MKIFRTEEGQNKVYVQMNDIAFLTHSNMAIPASIFTKVFSGIVIVDDRNRFDFIEFDYPSEIKFFKDASWIIDYDEFIQFSDEELDERANQIIDQINEIVDKYNNMPEEEQKKNQHLVEEYELKEYMLNYCREIYALKHGTSTMDLPDFISDSSSKTKEKKKVGLINLKEENN